MDLIQEYTLLVDGDPLSYRFGVDEDPERAWSNLQHHVRSVMMASGATSSKIFLTGPDCLKGYRYHLAKIKPYQGNRKGKTLNLPTRKYLWNRMQDAGGITSLILEADDMIVATGNRDPEHCIILSPDKDMHQCLAPVWMSEYKQPYVGYHILSQILQGDRADNVPGLVYGIGPKKAAKILDAFESLQEARRAVLDMAEGNTLRLAEISALLLLGAWRRPSDRVRSLWDDLIPEDDLREIDARCPLSD